MKKYLQIISVIILMMVTFSLHAQNINIPDAYFKEALLNGGVDSNKDGEIQESEALAIDTLDISDYGIPDITGINYFKNIKYLNCNYNEITTLDFSVFPHLEYLDCSNNNFSSLDVSSLTKLQYLNCTSNELTNLNVSGLTNLQTIYCYYNKLTNLDVSGITNLQLLNCSDNRLTNLNLSGLTNLQNLNCMFNQLSNIDVSDLSSLERLTLSYNNLTKLELNDLANLKYFDCEDNLITKLDISRLTNLEGFAVGDSYLEELYFKNGIKDEVSNEKFRIFFDAPIKYLCIDEVDINAFKQMALSSDNGDYSHVIINSFCGSTINGVSYTLSGKASWDKNNNGCDISDSSYPNLKIKINNDIDTGYLISGSDGNFSLDLNSGTYTFQPIIENPYFSVNPVSASFTLPDTISPTFCITPNGVHNDLSVSIIPTRTARPGFSDATYKVVYKNQGTTTQSGSVTFNYDEAKMNFISASPIADNTSNGKVSFNFSGLAPFETRSAIITMRTNSPSDNPAVNSGDVLEFTAGIIGAIDETPEDNLTTLSQTVVGSFDPNDKTCLEGEIVSPERIGKNVHYLIRFENEGTANAENIVVTDYIDTTVFDINTLQITDASHTCHTQISQGNKVQFIFSDIQLPFTEPNKHGNVAFSIKLKDNLVIGDSIQNKADIYFDYNLPVGTNNAISEINYKTVTYIGRNNALQVALDIYPNPSNGQFALDLKADIKTPVQISIMNVEGKVVFARQLNHQQHSVLSLDLKDLAKGVYLIKAQIENEVFSKKVVIQ